MRGTEGGKDELRVVMFLRSGRRIGGGVVRVGRKVWRRA